MTVSEKKTEALMMRVPEKPRKKGVLLPPLPPIAGRPRRGPDERKDERIPIPTRRDGDGGR